MTASEELAHAAERSGLGRISIATQELGAVRGDGSRWLAAVHESDAVAELGFIPDGAARALSARLKEVIGVVIRRPTATINDGGDGYFEPLITITDATGPGTGATATPVLSTLLNLLHYPSLNRKGMT